MIETRTSKRDASLAIKLAHRERASIRQHAGALTLFVDDEPRAPIFASASTPGEIAAAGRHGISLVQIELPGPLWQKPNLLDEPGLEAALAALAGAPLSTRAILVITVDPPEWWIRANIKELALYCDANDATAGVVSYASDRWMKESGEALERLVKHVLNSVYARTIMGVVIVSGDHGAFMYPNSRQLPDVGPRMRDRFVQLVRERYRNNAGLLKQAWFDAKAEFARIACPDAAERSRWNLGVFRNPQRARRLIDYYECMSKAQSAAALHFCSIVKRVSHRTLIVGLRAAPVDGDGLRAECGHLYPDDLLASENVDFFAEPQAGPAAVLHRPYRGSCHLYNKLVLTRDAGSANAADGVGAIVSALSLTSESAAELKSAPGRARGAQAPVAVVMDPAASLYVAPRADCADIQALIVRQLEILNGAGPPVSYYSISDLFHPRFPDHRVTFFPACFYLSNAERRRLDARIKRSGQIAVWFWAPGIIGEDAVGPEAGMRCCGQRMRVEAGSVSMRTRVVRGSDALMRGRTAGFGTDESVSPVCTISDAQAVRLGANSANKTVWSVRRFETWTSVVFGCLPAPLDLIQNVLRETGCE